MCQAVTRARSRAHPSISQPGGPDGRLGVSGAGGGNTITVQIATPDVESFRRSESYITGQIARAVTRGQRSL